MAEPREPSPESDFDRRLNRLSEDANILTTDMSKWARIRVIEALGQEVVDKADAYWLGGDGEDYPSPHQPFYRQVEGYITEKLTPVLKMSYVVQAKANEERAVVSINMFKPQLIGGSRFEFKEFDFTSLLIVSPPESVRFLQKDRIANEAELQVAQKIISDMEAAFASVLRQQPSALPEPVGMVRRIIALLRRQAGKGS